MWDAEYIVQELTASCRAVEEASALVVTAIDVDVAAGEATVTVALRVSSVPPGAQDGRKHS